MSLLSRYDLMNRPELRREVIKRKILVYLNSSGMKFRLALIEDDLKRGVNPYLEQSVPSVVEVSAVLSDAVGPQTRQ